jgi:hypothetical protein
MSGAFHCIQMQDSAKEKTAFASPYESFQQKRLGFGLCNGPATYCRLVERILQGIPTTVTVGFLDDGVIHSRGLDAHIQNLTTTLSDYAKAGLKLSPKKCNFFRAEITFLGHTLNASGIKPIVSYVKSILNWKLPVTKSAARAFLGVTGYYRQFIKDYSAIAAPWTDVIGKTDNVSERRPLVVSTAMIAAFEKLRIALTTAPVLRFPYFHGKKCGQFTLDTDFSKNQIRAVLSQRQGNQETVIAYGSKKLNKTQQNWHATKGKMYAGIHFMSTYAYFLQFGPAFRWRTDNSALTHIRSMNAPPTIIQNWLTTLADFVFIVEHRPGIKHVNADAMSRHSSVMSEVDESKAESDDVTPVCRCATTAQWMEPADDPDLRQAISWVSAGKGPDKLNIRRLTRQGRAYWGLFNSDLLMTTDMGILHYTSPNQSIIPQKTVPCIPKHQWEEVIQAAHISAGHEDQGPETELN